MTTNRWEQVKEIFNAVIERAPGERSFLSSACGGDDDLRREIESLLASHEKDGSFIDSPAYEAAAELIVKAKAELKPGQVIGSCNLPSQKKIVWVSHVGRGMASFSRSQLNTARMDI